MERMWPECVTFPAMELGILPLMVKFFLLSYISLAKDCKEKQCDFNQLDLKIFQPYLSTTTEGIFISSLYVQCWEILFHVTMRCAWMYEWRKKGGTCEEASCTQWRCAFPCSCSHRNGPCQIYTVNMKSGYFRSRAQHFARGLIKKHTLLPPTTHLCGLMAVTDL